MSFRCWIIKGSDLNRIFYLYAGNNFSIKTHIITILQTPFCDFSVDDQFR